MLLDWLAGKAKLRYPVPPAPRTSVLLPVVRPGAQVRVFAEGWGDKAEAFQPAAVAGAWAQFEELLGPGNSFANSCRRSAGAQDRRIAE